MSHRPASPPGEEDSLAVSLELQQQPGSPTLVAVFLTPVKASLPRPAESCASSLVKLLRPPCTPLEERELLSSVRKVMRDHLQSVKKGGAAERAAAVSAATADLEDLGRLLWGGDAEPPGVEASSTAASRWSSWGENLGLREDISSFFTELSEAVALPSRAALQAQLRSWAVATVTGAVNLSQALADAAPASADGLFDFGVSAGASASALLQREVQSLSEDAAAAAEALGEDACFGEEQPPAIDSPWLALTPSPARRAAAPSPLSMQPVGMLSVPRLHAREATPAPSPAAATPVAASPARLPTDSQEPPEAASASSPEPETPPALAPAAAPACQPAAAPPGESKQARLGWGVRVVLALGVAAGILSAHRHVQRRRRRTPASQ